MYHRALSMPWDHYVFSMLWNTYHSMGIWKAFPLLVSIITILIFLINDSRFLQQLVAYCVYQIYFHPYAKYPGPLLGKITVLRATYHAWKGDIHLDMWYCHQKYGKHENVLIKPSMVFKCCKHMY